MRFVEEFTVEEAAKRLGVSVGATYKLIRTGALKAENAGFGRTLPRYRVREDDLHQYMVKAYPMK